MNFKKYLLSSGVAIVALGSVVALADLNRHPHLLAAQRSLDSAERELQDARAPHGFGGHREKALQLLRDAEREIRESADFADRH